MKHFSLQRLHLKSCNLDKFDFLDEYSTTVDTPLPNCLLTSQEKTKDSEFSFNSSRLSTFLLLEGFSSQRLKLLAPEKYSSGGSVLVTLRKNKLYNFFDTCLNSRFLLTKVLSSKLPRFSKFSFRLDSIPDDNLFVNNTSKLLAGKEVKLLLSYKSLPILSRYLN